MKTPAPIGKLKNIRIENGKLIGTGVFIKGLTPKQKEALRYVTDVEIGFIALEKEGDKIKEAELVEISFVRKKK